MDNPNRSPAIIEAPEPELMETLPQEPTDQQDSKLALENTLWLADHADQLVEAFKTIGRAVLKIAHDGDWVKFGNKGCLSSAGAERIAAIFGIGQKNWSSHKETGRDDKGEWLRWWYEVDVQFRGRTVRGIGTSGSRDKFFGYVGGVWKEMQDLDEQNIRKAARHAAYKEGIRILLGLRNIPIEVLREAGVKLDLDTQEVKFNSKTPQKPASNGTQAPAPMDKNKTTITESQGKMLYALTKKLGLDKESMVKIMKKMANKESSKDLTVAEASVILKTLDQVDAKVMDLEWDDAGQPLFIPVKSEE